MSKLRTGSATRTEYRLTGIGCVYLNPTAFCIGINNISGGHQIRFSAWDPVTHNLTVSDGEFGKMAPGMEIFIWTTMNDDNSPYAARIAKVDRESRRIMLDRDMAIPAAALAELQDWHGVIQDPAREETAFACGNQCFATGDNAFASGALTVASGFGSTAAGVLSKATGDMSFACGNMAVASGLAGFASGCNTLAAGMFATAIGASAKATGDNSFAGGMGSEASGDSAVAIGFNTKATGRGSLAGGQLCEAAGDYSTAVGRQLKNYAKSAVLVGTHGELAGTVENTGAFALAAGNRYPILIRPFRAVPNPLYPQAGEPQYITAPDFSITLGGHLLAATEAVTGTTLVMDHGKAGRWKVTPSGTMTPMPANWRDGDRGELIIYNGGSKILFPSSWNWIGAQPTLKTNGVDIFTLFQVDEQIFIKHEATV